MPESHRQYAAQTPERILDDAARIGIAMATRAERIIDQSDHPEHGCRVVLGILRLSKAYGPQRLESAAMRALVIDAMRYQSIESILKNGLDRQPHPEHAAPVIAPITHENLRGAAYYSIDVDATRQVLDSNDHLSLGGPRDASHTHD